MVWRRIFKWVCRHGAAGAGPFPKRGGGAMHRQVKGVLLALLCVAMVVAGCGDDDGAAYKARVLGTWVSDHQRYEGCTLTIRQRQMIFETASGHVTINAISDIHYRAVNGAHLLELDIQEGGEPAYVMSFFLEKIAEGDILRFKNQRDVIWRHAEGA